MDKKETAKKSGTKNTKSIGNNTKIGTEYNHLKVEKKWQKFWQEDATCKTLNAKDAIKKGKKPFYALDMFPYPSGAGLHVGHPRGYIGSDVLARMKRMQGYNVLHPMGFDSFGLPAEQYAIKTGKHPGPFTDKLVKDYIKQLSIIGFSYDWDRMVTTHSPEYYKFTQEIFLKIYNSYFDTKKQKAIHIDNLIKAFEKSGNKVVNESTWHSDVSLFTAKDWNNFSKIEKQNILMNYRLAYEGFAEVNWCEELGSVLANDEIVDTPNGPVSERGEYPVTKKKMRQWFMRISAYGDRLINGLDTVDFLDSTKETQKNWIGKSEGSEIDFKIKDTDEKITVFTTRADTLFGVTYVVLAPEHDLVNSLKANIQNWNEVEKYLHSVKNKTIEERQDSKEKTGIVLDGIYAINPANNEQVPVWVADYVLASYGTGAVMAVPAHDERDFEFAKKYDLRFNLVISPRSGSSNEYLKDLEYNKYINFEKPFTKEGVLIFSDKFSNLSSQQAKKEITKFVGGKMVTKYKMRDAIFARQRYWGEPIPLYRDSGGIIHEVKKLPLVLPNIKSFAPKGDGQSPLANSKDWVKSGYETNTMPGWAGSSWYFLRYTDPSNKKAISSNENLDYFFGKNGGVDMYVGGTEHNTGHLLYARFWHKVLHDLGIVKSDEPFRALRHQGLIGGSDGRKMSKRWGNVINPDDIVHTYGADTLRVYEMFMGPFDAHLPWSTESIMGSRRFIDRIWRASIKIHNSRKKTNIDVLYALQDLITKVTNDISDFKFNTAVSAMMIFLNLIEEKDLEINDTDFLDFMKLLAPFAPHIVDEIYKNFGHTNSIHTSSWPKARKLKERVVMQKIMVQVNGKLRGELFAMPGETVDDLTGKAINDDRLRSYITAGEILRTIYVPGKLINFVVKVTA